MEKNRVRSDVRLSADPSRSAERRVAQDDDAFDVVVFTEPTESAGAADPSRPIRVDGDTFAGALAQLAPGWRGTMGGDAEVTLSFRSLDDFHPDRVVDAVAPLAALLAARRDPSRMPWPETPSPSPARRPEPAVGEAGSAPARPSSDSLSLDDLIGAGTSPRRATAPTSDLQPLIERLVAPHLVHTDRQREAAVIAALDAALATYLRAILHDANFRRAESLWRSMFLLVAAAEASAAALVRVWVLPCRRAALAQQLAGDPEEAPLTAALFRRIAPALLIGDWTFAHTPEDVALLERLGELAARVGAPFIGAASPQLLGCAAFSELEDVGASTLAARADGAPVPWRALRDGAAAPWLGLAAPRVLGRLPYGGKTRPIDSFEFEEIAAESERRAALLWMNPAFAVAAAVVRAFGQRGWSFDPRRDVRDIDEMPFFVYREHGESAVIPGAEVLLTDRQVDALAELGVLVLRSQRDSAAIALPAMQSVSSRHTALPLGVLRPTA